MGAVRNVFKRLYCQVSPTYRSIRRVEERLEEVYAHLEGRMDRQETLFWYGQSVPGKPLSQTKKDFFRGLPPAEGVLRKIQLGNLCLLWRLKELCREQEIPYWLSFGTLLGAARHGGFIPWDDDIDVSLLRDDFRRLQTALETSDFMTLRPYFDEDGGYYLHKLVFQDSPEHFWIDITVWDYADTRILGVEETWRRITAVREETLQELQETAGSFGQRYHSEPLSAGDAAALQPVFERNRKKLPRVREPDTIYRSIDSVYLGGETLLRLEEVFPLSNLPFEGERYPVPCQYEKYLERVYRWLDFPRNLLPGHGTAEVREEQIDAALSTLGLAEEIKRRPEEEPF